MSGQYLQLDSRKRVSLAKMATADNYLATVEPSGRIILEPATVVTAVEARVLDDEALRQTIATRVTIDGPTSPRRPLRGLPPRLYRGPVKP